MIRQVCIAAVLTALVVSLPFSKAVASGGSADNATNAINANPLALAFGGLNASYEHLFAGRYGLMVQSGFTFKGGYGVALHYRHHFFTKPKHNGFNSPFWGPFIQYRQGPIKWVDKDNDDTEYDIDVAFLVPGVNIGRRWVWGAFNMVLRIGYGYPVMADIKWAPADPEEVKAKDAFIRAYAGMDGELSIGFVF